MSYAPAPPHYPQQASAPPPQQRPRWGRVLIAGGTEWDKLGRKNSGPAEETDEIVDLLSPHILRSLSNVAVTSIHASAHGCHCVAVDVNGFAWLFGRNTSSCLGVTQCDAISENAPRKISPQELGAVPGVRFVSAAVGRAHTLLISSDGNVWTAGANTLGQCGHPVCPEITTWKAIAVSHHGQREHVVSASAGIGFSLLLTHSGKIFSVGSGEHGQLGNGRTGEHIGTGNKTLFDIHSTPVLVRGLEGKQITQISCGQQHSIALDSTGVVYVWGYAGYCRLGLGNQVDQMVPTVVPAFAGAEVETRGMIVSTGPSSSAVVDRTGMYWMAGKWKTSGEGSSGSPYSSFRYMQDIMGCKAQLAKSGGVTHWILTPDDDNKIMTVGWGQNATNGELGLGEDEPKSATKPIRVNPLTGVDVFDIAPGQNNTLFLARPNDKLSDLPRHPAEVEAPPACLLCKEDTGEEDTALECEKCDAPYHLRCLNKYGALSKHRLNAEGIPEGEWFCGPCEATPGAPIGRQLPAWAPKTKTPRGQKRSQVVYADDDEDDGGGSDDKEKLEESDGDWNGRDEEEEFGKRKGGKGAAAAPKRRRT